MTPLFETPPRRWMQWCIGHEGLGPHHAPMSSVVAVLLVANLGLALSDAPSPAPSAVTLVPQTVATPAPTHASAAPTDPAVARMHALLQTPWADWLAAFEAHLPAHATLAAMESDAQSQRVDVQAQADALHELLAFGQALETSPRVLRVEPQAHLPDPQDHAPGRLRMRWRITLLDQHRSRP
jgi:hypothetical protein